MDGLLSYLNVYMKKAGFDTCLLTYYATWLNDTPNAS